MEFFTAEFLFFTLVQHEHVVSVIAVDPICDAPEMTSRCFRVLEHRDLHFTTEAVQPGDVCGLAGVGGRGHEVSLRRGRGHHVAG